MTNTRNPRFASWKAKAAMTAAVFGMDWANKANREPASRAARQAKADPAKAKRRRAAKAAHKQRTRHD